MTLIDQIRECNRRGMDVTFAFTQGLRGGAIMVEVRVSDYHSHPKSPHCHRIIDTGNDDFSFAKCVEHCRNEILKGHGVKL